MFDFASNRELRDLSGVPENLRPFYKEKEGGGGYKLDSENPVVKGAVEVISGQGAALASARTDADTWKGKVVDLAPLGDYGADVEAIKTGVEAKLTELRKQAKNGANLQAELDRQRTEMSSTHDKEKGSLEERIGALNTQLDDQLIDREVLEASADRAENPKLLIPFVRARVKTIEVDGGGRVVRVLKPNGDIHYSGATGGPMTVKELVREMEGSKEYATLFKSEVRSGSGHQPGTGGAGGFEDTSTMTSNQKINAGLKALRP